MADKYAAKEAEEKAERSETRGQREYEEKHGHRAIGDDRPAPTKKPRGANPPKATKPIELVVGLGNPGPEYAQTRHNSGFQTVDELAKRWGVTYWKSQDGALVATAQVDGRTITLAKPQSYMNCSGGPVSKLVKRLGLEPQQLLVVHDDLDIPAGDVRVKIGGGHGGQNGLRSIIDKLGSRDFVRVRDGIGRPPGKMDPADYVLKQMKGDVWEEQLAEASRGADAVELVLKEGPVRARDQVNGQHGQ